MRPISSTGLVALLLECACQPQYDPPEGPDLDWLIDAYEHPTADVSEDQVQALTASMLADHLLVRALGSLHFVPGALTDVQEGLHANGIGFDAELPVEGELSTDIVCPGMDPETERTAAKNGKVGLTVPVVHGELGPVVFGTARKCRFALDWANLAPWVAMTGIQSGALATVDGPIAVHLGQRIGLADETIELRPIIQVEGTTVIDGGPSFESLDFRIAGEALRETRLVLADDTWVILFSTLDGFGVRGRRGSWTCTERAQCVPAN